MCMLMLTCVEPPELGILPRSNQICDRFAVAASVTFCDLRSWWTGLSISTFLIPSPAPTRHAKSLCPALCHISEMLFLYPFSSISSFNPLLYSSAVCFQTPLNLFWSNSTAMCTSVSKSESPGGGLSSKSCQEDKEAGQPSANCQCP